MKNINWAVLGTGVIANGSCSEKEWKEYLCSRQSNP